MGDVESRQVAGAWPSAVLMLVVSNDGMNCSMLVACRATVSTCTPLASLSLPIVGLCKVLHVLGEVDRMGR